jgi:hypothetical protein
MHAYIFRHFSVLRDSCYCCCCFNKRKNEVFIISAIIFTFWYASNQLLRGNGGGKQCFAEWKATDISTNVCFTRFADMYRCTEMICSAIKSVQQENN